MIIWSRPDLYHSAGKRHIGYSAFISYSHRDRRWAKWLHRALESYRVPKRLRGRAAPYGRIEARIPPVFRDRDELAASSDLAQSVREGLAASAMLIVICSPDGARSKWVNEEIRTFSALGRRDRIRCLVVAGEPHGGDPATECLPPALFEGGGTEPLAADLRKGEDGKAAARLKIIAGIIGVPYDELRQREAVRRQQRLAIIAGAATIGFLLMAGLAVVALIQRNIARERTATAEQTVAFVKSMFEVSDPSEARGATITAREVLDRGARRIDRELGGQPAVKAELGVTLSEVYGSLGLYRESDRLIRQTFSLHHEDRSTEARQYLALGESLARAGDYRRAIGAYETAIGLARRWGSLAADLLPRMLVRRAESQQALGLIDAAEASASEALALDRARQPADQSDIARDLEVLGAVAIARRDFRAARGHILQALALRLRTEGPLSPSVTDNYNLLANIAETEGNLATAERYYRRNLASDEKVLGGQHPDLAGTLNNLSWVLLQRRHYGEAARLLERALAINLRQRDITHDDLAYIFTNLAIIFTNLAMARRGLGETREAERLLGNALAAARRHNHPMLPVALTDLAEIRCETRRAAEGLPLLDEAQRLLAEGGVAEPWELAWNQSIRGECALVAGRRGEGARLLRASAPVLRARWPRGTHFREELETRLKLLA